MKILVTRTDRLGDVLLATPVLKQLKETYPQAEITFLVQKLWMDVLQYADVRLMEYAPNAPDLVERLKKEKFDFAVVLRDEKPVSLAIKKAGIPYRIGPYSTLRSFFLFNHGKWQRRSRCKMHEAQYNLQLLEKLPHAEKLPSKESLHSWVVYSTSAQEVIEKWLSAQHLTPGQYVCVHPGSSGSSRYLKIERMIALVQELIQKNISVVLTGGMTELELLHRIAEAIQGKVHIFAGKPLSHLAELYRHSSAVIAHGTGPLHLAAAVDAPVYALFPPIFVLSEKRWGPLTAQREVWTPHVPCPAHYRCLGEKCPYFDCMDRFKIEEAVQKILEWNRK